MSDSFTPVAQDSFTPQSPSKGDSFVPLPRDSFSPVQDSFKSDPSAVQDHVQTRMEIFNRASVLQDIFGLPQDLAQAHAIARDRAQEIAPVDENTKTLIDQTITPQDVRNQEEAFAKLKQSTTEVRGGFEAPPDFEIPSDIHDPRISPEANIARTKANVEELAQENKAPMSWSNISGKGLYNVELATEGALKATSVQPLRALGYLAKLTDSAASEAMGYRKALNGSNPSLDDYLKRFTDTIDHAETFDPDNEGHRTFINNMFQFMGQLPTLALGGTALGRAGMATYLTLMGANSVGDTGKALAKANGADDDTARRQGTELATLSLPLNYILGRYSPLSRLETPGALGTSLSSRVISGGMSNLLASGGMNEVRSILSPMFTDPLHRNAIAMQMYGYSLRPDESSVALELGTGMLMGGISPSRRLEVENALNRINIKPDALNRDELMSMINRNAQGANPETIKAGVDIFDTAARELAKKQGVPVEEIYAQHLWNLNTRVGSTGDSSQILSEQGAKFADALGSNNVPQAMRGLADIFRNGFLSSEDLKTIEDQIGVKPPGKRELELQNQRAGLVALRDQLAPNSALYGTLDEQVKTFDKEHPPEVLAGKRWSEDYINTFTETLTKYLRDGISPSGGLNEIFKNISDVLKGAYSRAEMLPDAVKISPELGEVFDKMFVRDNDPVRSARNNLNEAELALQVAQKDVDVAREKAPQGEDTLTKREANLIQAKQLFDQRTQELRQAQQNNFNPRTPTRAEKMYQDYHNLFESLVQTPEDQGRMRSVRGAFSNFLPWIADAGRAIQDNPVGGKIVEMGKQFFFDTQRMVGDMKYARDAMLRLLSPQDVAFLKDSDENGISNRRKILDGTIKPQTPGQQAFYNMSRKVFDYVTSEQLQNQVLRRLRDGDTPPAIASKTLKAPQLLSPFGHNLMEGKMGDLAFRYLENVRSVNDDPTITLDQILNELTKRTQSVLSATQGSIEGQRGELILPDAVKDVNGKQYDVFHNDPVDYMNSWIGRSAKRLSFIRNFGQGILENLATKGTESYNRQLDLIKLFEKLPQDVGADGAYSVEALRNQLLQKLPSQALSDLNKAQLVKLSQEYNLPTKLELDKMDNIISMLNSQELSPEKVQELRALATKAGGIDSRRDPQMVLDDLRHRYTTPVEDNLAEVAKRAYRASGGDPGKIDEYFRRLNSVFGDKQGSPDSLWFKTLSGVNNVISPLMTSLAWLRHIAQPILQAHNVSGNPIRSAFEIVKAEHDAWFERAKLEEDPEVQRYLSNFTYAMRSRTISGVSSFGAAFRNGVDSLTGKALVRHINELTSVQVGRYIADKWTQDGIKDHEKGLALRFGLSGDDIDLLRDRGVMKGGQWIPLDANTKDALFQKVVRGYMAKTLGGSFEMPQHRSVIETSPIMNAAMGWQSFLSLRVRNTIDTLEEFKNSLTPSGDVKDQRSFLGASARLLTFIGATVGVGVLQNMFRNALEMKKQKLDEGFWDHVRGSLLETGFFGYPTAIYENMQYSKWNAEKFAMGMFPQITGLTRLIGTMIGEGRYGKFPIGTRTVKALEGTAPLASVIDRHLVAQYYPSVTAYNDTRSLYRAFAQKQPGYQAPSDDDQIRPDLYGVFQDVQRNDRQSAIKDMGAYVQNEMKSGVRPVDALRFLKASLEDRRPVPLNPRGKDWMKFMQGLSVEDRQKVILNNSRYENLVKSLIPKAQ